MSMTSLSAFSVPRAVLFSEGQMERINESLDELARNTGAWSILLADTTGQLIEIKGRLDKKKAEALASLIAGSYAASAEFIKLMGEGKDTDVSNLSHEATDYSIFSTIVAEVLILSVSYKKEVKIGIVRVFVEQARHRLLEIVREASLTNSDAKDVNLQFVGEDLNQLLNDELEKLTEFEA